MLPAHCGAARANIWLMAKLIAKINDGVVDSRTQVRSAH